MRDLQEFHFQSLYFVVGSKILVSSSGCGLEEKEWTWCNHDIKSQPETNTSVKNISSIENFENFKFFYFFTHLLYL